MSKNLYIKSIKALGELPEGVLGFLRANSISHNVDYSRVYVPRQYTGLDKNLLPCYDMPEEKNRTTYWVEILEEMLTVEEKQMLTDLEKEIDEKEKFFIGPEGIFVRAMGNIGGKKIDGAIKDILEGMSNEL